MKPLFVFMALIGLSLRAEAQVVNTIDLAFVPPTTVPQPNQPRSEPVINVGDIPAVGRSSHAEAPQRSTLRLRIEFIDNDVYALGDKFNLRLSIRNVGSAPSTIPLLRWSEVGWRLPERKNLVTAALRLQISVPGREPAGFFLGALYGATDDPTTLQVLRPGESVEVLVSAPLYSWPTGFDSNLGTATPGTVRAGMDWAGESWLPEWSETKPIHVRPKVTR